LKVLEKSLNLSLANFEILHLLTVSKQASKQIDDGNLSLAFIITVLVSAVQYTSVSHCSLSFECLLLGYDFLSIILVLKNAIWDF